MYFFAPGTGCTGPTKLVRPGDELMFNSLYNSTDWINETKLNTGEEESALPYTCLGRDTVTSGHDFKLPLPENELVELAHKNFPDEIMKQICWLCKMQNADRHSLGLDYIHCDFEDSATISVESLKYALCQFIVEVKKLNGEDFPGKNLFHIVVYTISS